MFSAPPGAGTGQPTPATPGPSSAGQAAAAAAAATAAAAAVMGTRPTTEAVHASMEATYQVLQSQLEFVQVGFAILMQRGGGLVTGPWFASRLCVGHECRQKYSQH